MASSLRLKSGPRVSGEEILRLMEGHVSGIIEVRGVTAEFREGARAKAWPSERRVLLRPVRSARTYFEALHELGHVLAQGRTIGGRFAQEGRAWQWALEEALIYPTDGVQNMIKRCLGNYQSSYLRRERRGQKVIWPPAEHAVWRLLAHGR